MKLMVIFKPLEGYRQFHMFLREKVIERHNYFKNKFIRMPLRPRVRIGNLVGRLIAEQYRQHGPLWDIIVNFQASRISAVTTQRAGHLQQSRSS